MSFNWAVYFIVLHTIKRSSWTCWYR